MSIKTRLAKLESKTRTDFAVIRVQNESDTRQSLIAAWLAATGLPEPQLIVFVDPCFYLGD